MSTGAAWLAMSASERRAYLKGAIDAMHDAEQHERQVGGVLAGHFADGRGHTQAGGCCGMIEVPLHTRPGT